MAPCIETTLFATGIKRISFCCRLNSNSMPGFSKKAYKSNFFLVFPLINSISLTEANSVTPPAAAMA